MPGTSRITSMVATYWPGYVQMVGEDAVALIVDEVRAGRDPLALYQPTRGGERFDLRAIIELLTAGVVVLDFGVRMIDRRRGSDEPPRTVHEIHVELVAEADRLDLPPSVRDQLPEIAAGLEEQGRSDHDVDPEGSTEEGTDEDPTAGA
ncbi:hypothetical protein ACWGR4_30850 [Embleya sp. NPDC055664]